jgi:hypothetical protein
MRRRPPAHPFLRRLAAATGAGLVLMAVAVAGFLAAAREAEVFSDRSVLAGDEVLWGPAFAQQAPAYKLRRTVHLKPELLVVGSSRVTQFRDAMAPGVRFYNAALGASSLPQLLDFAESLYPRFRPKAVLVGLDPWWFSPHRGMRSGDLWRFDYLDVVSAVLHDGLRWQVIRPLLAGAANGAADPLGGRRPVGYLAAVHANGFRADGSFQYGSIILGRDPLQDLSAAGFRNGFAYYRNSVRNASGRFGYTGPVGGNRLDDLRRFLALSRANGVEVVLTFQPVAAAVWREIEATPAQRAWFAELTAAARRVAEEAGVELFAFHDLAELGVSDAHTIDDIHVDEVATVAVMDELARRSAVLGRLLGAEGKARLAALRRAGPANGTHLVAR